MKSLVNLKEYLSHKQVGEQMELCTNTQNYNLFCYVRVKLGSRPKVRT